MARVTWEFDSEAEQPLAAAREARGAMQSVGSIALGFLVETADGRKWHVDLWGDPVVKEVEICVPCCHCGLEVSAETAHLHQGQWIGDECCWDERLRSSE